MPRSNTKHFFVDLPEGLHRQMVEHAYRHYLATGRRLPLRAIIIASLTKHLSEPTP